MDAQRIGGTGHAPVLKPSANNMHGDIDPLANDIRQSGRSMQRKQTLLISFANHTPLFLHRK
jgi:hypothetical protein